MEIFEGIIEVRSSAGDNHLGGEDFNQVLIEDFYAAKGFSLGPRYREKSVLHERVREQAERARRELTKQSSATMTVTWQEQQVEHSIDTERFEKLCEPLLTLSVLQIGGLLFMSGVALSMGVCLYNDWRAAREGDPSLA